MNLQEAKDLFNKYHPEEAVAIATNSACRVEAGCVWYGFKSALEIMGHLLD